MTHATNTDLAQAVSETIAGFLERRVPRATYRLQLNRTFTFRQTEEIAPYLAALGISHVYVSPIFKAIPGSMHGYDVVDYTVLNPEIGSRSDFDSFVTTLQGLDLKLIVDFVPNHMGIENGQNAWWQDVLEHGPRSRFAEYFDIDWNPIKRELRGKVLLPFLGDQYGTILENGELKLVFEAGAFRLDYWDTPFPIAPSTYPLILRKVEERLEGELDPEAIELLELRSVRTALEHLDVLTDTESIESDREVRQREQLLAKHRLATLCEQSPVIGLAVADVVAAFNGVPGDPPSFDALDQVLDHQFYRLSSWRVAAEEINYRRFFAINTLASIRQEVPEVFDDTHGFLMSLVAEGAIDGVRIDHPDGLWDPAGYFRSVQRLAIEATVRRQLDGERAMPSVDEEWVEIRPSLHREIDAALDQIAASGGRWPLFVVAEKILEHGETLRDDWAVSGTVGYEFAQAATSVFVDSDARQLFDRIYARYTGDRIRFPELVYEMKQRMMREAFASEVNVLTNEANRISEQDRHSRDFTLNNLRDALREILACFSVYRTYSTAEGSGADDRDRRYIEGAVAQAKRRNPTMDASVFDFVADVLLRSVPQDPALRPQNRSQFGMKLQQLSGPVMAKGLEDTAFYRFNRLMSLNEVGGDPSRFGISVEEFHRQNRARKRSWPSSMINSSTHDTKRSEDVRARINVLSEIPTEWRAALNRWSRMNRKLKRKIEGVLAPPRIDEYVIYQTLVGTWPLAKPSKTDWSAYATRLQEYVVKVGREANRLTNWVNPDEDYEAALTDFVGQMLNRRRSGAFLADLEEFVERVADAGMRNALAQQVLKLTSPGVPDIYQGTELWDDSLVDPDNRRPVDFDARSMLVGNGGDLAELWNDRRSGAVKLAVTARILALREAHPLVFADGDYIPLQVTGARAPHLIAFARRWEDLTVIVVVPRLTVNMNIEGNDAVWEDTRIILPEEGNQTGFDNVLAGGALAIAIGDDDLPTLMVSGALADLPVAILISSNADE